MKKLKKTKKAKGLYGAEEKKKKLSVPAVFALVAVLLMVASGIGYIWKGSSVSEYNGFRFKERGNAYSTKINGKEIYFYSLPSKAESINMSDEAVYAMKSTKMVYMTSDPESKYKSSIGKIEYDLMKNLAAEGIYPVFAFTDENQYNITQITCSNATEVIPVLFFANSSSTEITYENSCIILEGQSDYDFYILKDRLMYSFYGIIK